MRATSIVGPVTGRPCPAYDTGRRWNGASVIAFTSDVLAALIAAGDGTDANGEGLAVAEGGALDVSDGRAEPAETICAPAPGAATALTVLLPALGTTRATPAARAASTSARPTPRVVPRDRARCRCCSRRRLAEARGVPLAHPPSPQAGGTDAGLAAGGCPSWWGRSCRSIMAAASYTQAATPPATGETFGTRSLRSLISRRALSFTALRVAFRPLCGGLAPLSGTIPPSERERMAPCLPSTPPAPAASAAT